MEPFGTQLPDIKTTPPGPQSRRMQQRLAAAEAPSLTLGEVAIFWKEAVGSNVRDVDDNCYIDISAGFGVAIVGHGNERVRRAVQQQAGRLIHAMGDVYASDVRLELVEQLSKLAPVSNGRCFLATSGTEAVEIALKTAVLATGKPGVLAFRGGYHGLTLGALAATSRAYFRDPFAPLLSPAVVHLPYPYPFRFAGDEQRCLEAALGQVAATIEERAGGAMPIGAVVVEPIQGREGIIVPPAGWLAGLRAICDATGTLLIVDEILTGFGRTGRLFAVNGEQVEPDILCAGKGMTGGVPMAACIGRAEIMEAWRMQGEALHTTTFIGNPISCAAALATITEIRERQLVERSAALGGQLKTALQQLAEHHAVVGEVRGSGMMLGIELVLDRRTKEPAADMAWRALIECQQRGLILVSGGMHGNVINVTPPLVITERQLEAAVTILDEVLGVVAG